MGMTLWIHTLQGRNFSKDSDDHSLMNTHCDALDAICDAASQTKLSTYFDFTDVERNFADEDELDDDEFDEDAEDVELDPETGYRYGIDDMQWFSAVEGLASLQAMREAVADGAIDELDGDGRDELLEELLEELDDCIATLSAMEDKDAKFHLALVD